jgi:hypothetical protein
VYMLLIILIAALTSINCLQFLFVIQLYPLRHTHAEIISNVCRPFLVPIAKKQHNSHIKLSKKTCVNVPLIYF